MQAYLWTILISLLLLLKSAAQLLVEPCGSPLTRGRIMHGEDAEREAAAWMAGVHNRTNFQCGGTVIHRRFVLTAAHCIEGQGKLFVMLGAYNLSRPTVEYSVRRGIVHHGFDPYHSYAHDIGLLQLSRSIQFSETVYPICIIINPANKSKLDKLNTFDAYGWGRTWQTSVSELLQKVRLYRSDRSECDKDSYTPLTSNQICAGSSEGDTCAGDSGGPLTRKLSINSIVRQTQLGIVSFGKVKCDGEGTYTDVSSYGGWIEQTVRQFQSGHTGGFSGIDTSPQSSQPDSRSRPPPGFASSPTPNPRSRPPPGFASNPTPNPRRRPMFLYNECGGENIALNLLVKIYGRNGGFEFERNGVVITDRYVLTTAKDLPSTAVLDVAIAPPSSSYEEYQVESVIRHPSFSDDSDKHDIALLKLTKSVSLSGQKKPVCMLLDVSHFEEGTFDPQLTIFDYRRSTTTTPPITTAIPLVIEPVYSSECSSRIGHRLEQDQMCIKEQADMTVRYGQTGDILGAQMRHSGKTWYILVGIVSYSSSGMHILTDVRRYVHWIAGVVRNDSF